MIFQLENGTVPQRNLCTDLTHLSAVLKTIFLLHGRRALTVRWHLRTTPSHVFFVRQGAVGLSDQGFRGPLKGGLFKDMHAMLAV